MDTPKKYRITRHQSELAVRVNGDSQADLFTNSGIALFDVMVADMERIEKKERLPLEVEGTDRDDLMVNWVRELLYLYQGSGYLLREFVIREVKDTLVKAEVAGEKIDPDRHEIVQEIA
ncbi:MAG TPA: archease, partial [Candidatus Binatia bacterium]|nr:archease [Candidatus Binatia bacterium]